MVKLRKRLMPMNTTNIVKDYGADPLGDGFFRMVPSGDTVDRAERYRRLPPADMTPIDGVFGLSWDGIERKQGGRLNR